MKMLQILIVLFLANQILFAQNYSAKSISNSNPGFIQNHGQIKDLNGNSIPNIEYYINLKNLTVYFQQNSVSFVFHTPSNDSQLVINKLINNIPDISQNDTVRYNLERIDFNLENISNSIQLIAEDKKNEYYNYYFPNISNGSIKIYPFQKLIYKNIYPNIDLEWNVANGSLNYKFILNNNAKVEDIQISLEGAKECFINNGKLIINGNLGAINFNDNNLVFQNNSNILKYINKADKNNNRDKLLSQYSKVEWSTFMGGNDLDWGRIIKIDSDNNIVIGGGTFSTDFPLKIGTFQSRVVGQADFIIMKYNSCDELIWGTYLGGDENDYIYGLTIDNEKNIWFCGEDYSNNMPTTANAYSRIFYGYADCAVIKLANDGSLLYSTYIGGTSFDSFSEIAVDSLGNAFATGRTMSNGFPIVGSSRNTLLGTYDIIFAKFDKNGKLLYSSYLGGSNSEFGEGIAIDSNNNPIISGYTNSNDFPITTNAFQKTLSGNYDAFVIKFNNDLSIQWSTYFGGSLNDYGSNLIRDRENNIILGGYTESNNFPVTSNSYQNKIGGGVDRFLAKFDSNGKQLWTTYFGGAKDEGAVTLKEQDGALALDSANNIAMTGYTYSTNLPVTSDAFQKINAGIRNAYATIFDSTGFVKYSTYFGGSNEEMSFYPAFDKNNNLVITGKTDSKDFPILGNVFQSKYNDQWDGFIIKFGNSINKILTISPNTNIILCSGDSAILHASGTFSDYQWYKIDSTGSCLSYNDSLSVKNSGSYYCIAADHNGCPAYSDTINISKSIDNLSISASSLILCNNDSVMIKAPDNYTNYQWYKLDSASSCLSYIDSLSVKDLGKYYCIAVDKNGCVIYSDTINISKNIDNLSISASSLILCNNDSVIIKAPDNYANYQWFKLDSAGNCLSNKDSLFAKNEGKYYLIAKNQFGCTVYSDTINIIKSYSHINIDVATPFICLNDTSLLSASDGFYNYKWYKLNSNSIIASSQDYNAIDSGKYYCVAQNQYGCISYSDTITIDFSTDAKIQILSILKDDILNFDTVFYPLKNCTFLKFKNITSDTLTLSNVNLKRNVAFSVPQSQFPKILLPYAIDSIIICYSPTIIGNELDTIGITLCNTIYVKLSGICSQNIYNGESKCQEPIKIIIDSLSNIFHQDISQPMPNPGTDFVKVSFENYYPNNDNIPIKAELFDIYGNMLCIASINLKNTIIKGNSIITIGEYIFNTMNLNSGNYFIKISNPYNVYTWNVLILK